MKVSDKIIGISRNGVLIEAEILKKLKGEEKEEFLCKAEDLPEFLKRLDLITEEEYYLATMIENESIKDELIDCFFEFLDLVDALIIDNFKGYRLRQKLYDEGSYFVTKREEHLEEK